MRCGSWTAGLSHTSYNDGATAKGSQQRKVHELQGECYLHGAMCGDLMGAGVREKMQNIGIA